jgi:hypothetical protein
MENSNGWFGRFRAWLDRMTVNVFFIQNATFFQGKGKRRDLSSVSPRRNAGEILTQRESPRLPKPKLEVRLLPGRRELPRPAGSENGWREITRQLSSGKKNRL